MANAYSMARRSVCDDLVPPRLRLITFAPVSTAYAIAAANSKSVNLPSMLALIVVSCASPATPAMPSPFDAEPAASEATKVPCPTGSETSRELFTAL